MGFFSDLWEGIKSTASNVWSGIKSVASNIYGGVKSAADWIGDRIQPLVRGIGQFASNIPIIGAPVAAVANTIDQGITNGRRIVDNVGRWGSAIGGVIDRIVPNQTQEQKNATLNELRRRFQRPM